MPTIILSIQIAIRSMRANKLRTGLTVLGMVIGISAVIIVFSAGEGIKSLIVSQVESFGTDVIETKIKVPTSKKGAASEAQSATSLVSGVQITTLNLNDMKEIDKLANVGESYGGIIAQEQVSYANVMKQGILFGVSASFIDIDKTKVEFGSFFSEAEEKSLAQVVVLGPKVKNELFGDSDAIGQSIKIHKSKYNVIGIYEERGAVFGTDFDDYIYISLMTLQKRIMGIDHVLFLMHKIKDLSWLDETTDEIIQIMRTNHNITPDTKPDGTFDVNKDDFRVTPMIEALEILGTVTGAITLLLLAIVAISLIVGGVGIMNIMYVIISERTSEIGLRKTVGATFKDIMIQFLTESIIITIIGGFIGIIIGILFSSIIAWGANRYGLDWQLSIPMRSYVVALVFSLFFGVLFGLYPARKAAKLDPIEALRNE
ncbi:hypothetical protein COX67_04060 [Candidatus Falkowbacteria bacterium CG_4_10_14_0_2_um_filter_36_22]|nr:MAG: hypothetical protein COX67_04060 [Candidatus Falkowbacteria bacterium CG_4_10_14_0_2_um_filter_36_22]